MDPNTGVFNEDDVINSENKYHTNMMFIDMNKDVMRNSGIVVMILTMVTTAMLLLGNGDGKVNDARLNTLYSFMVISLFMTIAESVFVYWYNIQNVYNNIIEKAERDIGIDEYVQLKRLNTSTPNVVHNALSVSYQKNMQSITFIMYIPVLLICVFMLAYLTGKVSITYKDTAAIVINILLLVMTFGVTFVNLGMKQSASVDTHDIANTFDPFDEVHRFRESTDFVPSMPFTLTIAGLTLFCVALVRVILKYNT